MNNIQKTIPSVAKLLGVNESKLRYWDAEYGVIKEREASTNNRIITPSDIKLFTKIKLLLNLMTSDGVKAVLNGTVNIQVSEEVLKKLK